MIQAPDTGRSACPHQRQEDQGPHRERAESAVLPTLNTKAEAGCHGMQVASSTGQIKEGL